MPALAVAHLHTVREVLPPALAHAARDGGVAGELAGEALLEPRVEGHGARVGDVVTDEARGRGVHVGRGLEAARTMTWRAAWMADQGEPNAKEASMSKAMAGQAAIRACIEAIEICGAEGSIAKDHQLLEKWFRDIKVYDIFEGTGQIQRIVISKRLISDLKAF